MESNKTKDTDRDETVENSIKITITKDAEKVLSDVVKRINDTFEVGKVNRQSVASWLLQKACAELSDAYIKAIQFDNFDPNAALAALCKKVQQAGVMPPELKELLLKEAGLSDPRKRNTKTKLTNDFINDEVPNNS